jgi:hypothetical protein
MKRFLIEVKEISYGVVEVYACSEKKAREMVEEGDYNDFIVDDSEMILGNMVVFEDVVED